MQDIHAIGGGCGRLFGGVGDRRLRPLHHQSHQALKCPRCDSINTKFCYYNNYNLSQPRHFCKSCRRYWTKGGVLRNVPVGGGCRKNKRSKPKATSDAAGERKSNSNSSSDSSTLTAATTAATTLAAASTTSEVASASSSTSASTLLNFPDSRLLDIPQSTNPSFPPSVTDQSSERPTFPGIGSLTSMMMSSNDTSCVRFNVADVSAPAYRLHHEDQGAVVQEQSIRQQWQEQENMNCAVAYEMKMPEISAGVLDQMAQMDLSGLQNRGNNGGLGSVDWQGGGDQALFDLIGNVDQACWGQTQWTDNNHPLYLP